MLDSVAVSTSDQSTASSVAKKKRSKTARKAKPAGKRSAARKPARKTKSVRKPAAKVARQRTPKKDAMRTSGKGKNRFGVMIWATAAEKKTLKSLAKKKGTTIVGVLRIVLARTLAMK